MTCQKELFGLFGNGRRENIIFTLGVGETCTCYFEDDGTDTASVKYFNLGSSAKKVAITTNKIATITHINNQALKSPRSLGTGTINTWSSGIEWKSIVIRAELAATTFEIYAS